MDFNLLEHFGNNLSDYKVAQDEHYPILHNWLKNLESKTRIAFINANNVEYIGYSYAKQIFRKIISNLFSGQYKVYSICFRYDALDFEQVGDGLIYALNQTEDSIFWTGEELDIPKAVGYLSVHESSESKKVARKKEKQREVLEYIVKKNNVYTNDIANSLKLKLPNTNRILKDLEGKRLIRRIKETSPSGGPIYLNKSIFSA
ncbi:MAG TPA: hypothetical protein VE912_03850 [Bacteroidales bacterium]|nr:hypothetical protein [Bacteroidales bacterium]